ncbi:MULTISPECIES: hypothetical protein [Fusobacterium]|uniref:hypothetical protein n=1 Tax=Fusobacterium TaxID=848 RepID=UPI0008A2C341|nr:MULTISPECIES: hypothetical protein [Fusobacterium]OFL85868.1 hypothetical protein HMPREF2747_02755 [Fusobacterium sp. HMSC073F01]
MKDKARETVKAETKTRKRAATKVNTDSKTKTKLTKETTTPVKMGRKKTGEEVRTYRVLGSRFTSEELKYVERMIEELLPIYKNKSKILLAITKEFVSSPLNDEVLNRTNKISLGRWATVFGSSDIRKVLIVYFQLTRGFFIAPTRKLKTYPFIDLEMLDKDGKRYGIIVKSDNDYVDLEVIDKMKKKMKLYLLTTTEKKQELGDRDIEWISLKDIFKFMEKYQFLLPSHIVRKFKNVEELK